MRIVPIDGFRGLCLLLVGYAHAHEVLGSRLGQFNYQMVLWVGPAAGFVSISGFVVALGSAGLFRKSGQAAVDGFLFKRVRILATWHVLSVLVVLGMALGFAVPGADMSVVGTYPFAGTLLVSAFVIPEHYFNTLALYFFLLALSPVAFRICRKSSPVTLVALSVGVWIVSQTGFDVLVSKAITRAVIAVHGGEEWGRYPFRLLSWQIVFFVPFALGYAVARDRSLLAVLRTDPARHVFLVALAVFVGLAVLRSMQAILPDNAVLAYLGDGMTVTFHKWSVAGGYLLSFVLFGYLFVYLLAAGTAEDRGAIGAASRALRRFFSLPFLIGVGRASIHVFATSTMYVYFLVAIGGERLSEPAKDAMMVGSLILALVVSHVASTLKEARTPSRHGDPAGAEERRQTPSIQTYFVSK